MDCLTDDAQDFWFLAPYGIEQPTLCIKKRCRDLADPTDRTNRLVARPIINCCWIDSKKPGKPFGEESL